MKPKYFKNRIQAGELLADELAAYVRGVNVVVVALPRGSVPVGFAIVKKLEVPLDILLVRKLGLPGHEEYAMSAIASGGGVCILEAEVLSALEIPTPVIEAVAQRELGEIERREKLYRAGRPAPQLREHVVILVDDGVATGSTMQVAVHVVREANPARMIVAVPVGARGDCEKLIFEVDQLICLSTPEPFLAVGRWFENFEKTTDDEVKNFLEEVEQEQMRRTKSSQAQSCN